MNLSVTSPYNADFDGDEMNLHVPQVNNVAEPLNSLSCPPLWAVLFLKPSGGLASPC